MGRAWKELACTAFRHAVDALFVAEVDVVATVHTHLTDALERRTDIEVVQLTPANRDALPGELAARLQQPRTHEQGAVEQSRARHRGTQP
ncbi:nucleoside-triphosphatase THEP1 [Streptomyces griseochromogenes]|uniref:Nucleoside-triphosphatase THEP1 n=1 Tax=Streptomyces griseochromogenes TaxID=68214 RepID=A0ABS4M8A7_9ACTN|nr:nucleoside-triphosphatase [Streptomyces griseochromogenes]MBP2055576.1 nucleoside-triphosphatase THEP1 [Streptomyces griseochromogenes]